MKRVGIVLVLLVWASGGYGAENSLSTGAPGENPQSAWSGSAMIRSSTDLLQQVKPVMGDHEAQFGVGYTFAPDWILGFGLGAGLTTIGSEINADRASRESLLRDVSLSVGRDLSLATGHNVSLSLENEIPTSFESRMAGYRSVPSFSASYSGELPQTSWRLVGSSIVYHVVNEYSHSPATLRPNPAWGMTNMLGMRYFLTDAFFAGVGGNLRASVTTDSAQTVSFGNQVSTGLKYKNFQGTVFWMNGSFADRENVSFWFIDEYRKVLGVSLKQVF